MVMTMRARSMSARLARVVGSLRAAAFMLFALCAVAVPAQAENGVTADTIIVGQVAALSGPAAALGSGMRTGILAAFEGANAKGGVHGRKISLLSRDDSYEPADSEAQTKRMIEQDKIFALIGPVGTPTSKVAQPVAQAAGVPFFAPFTGAGFLRDARLDNVVNLRASYDQETERWIEFLTVSQKAKRIAIFYQDDAFGQAGLSGVKKAMTKRSMELVAEANFPRNTTQVKPALDIIQAAKPDAVVMVGPYGPCAAFIQQAIAAKLDAVFMNISFVGSEALAIALEGKGEGVIVSQVVPFPWDKGIDVVKAYQAALGGKEKPGFISLEGYLAGRLFLKALEDAGPEPTRAKLLQAVRSLKDYDMGGFKLSFGEGDNQGSEQVYLTRIAADGSFVPIHDAKK
jgi:branched-chain amino acid transport system substrate-binding protein